MMFLVVREVGFLEHTGRVLVRLAEVADNHMTQKSIKEEWRKTNFDDAWAEDVSNEIADWWLSKFSSLLQTIESEIEGEKPKRDYDGNNLESACDKYHIAADSWTEIIRFEDGMNHALDSAKAIISKYKEI
jgi:hypothetical protein